MDVTVVCATFGDESWATLARTRALASVPPDVPCVHVHGTSLHEARNQALARVGTEWVVHLDADDELEGGYLAAMAAGTADVRGPVIRFMVDGRERGLWQPRVWRHRHTCTAACITSGLGNWLPVSACARTRLLREVGGWRDYAWSEDFDLWMRVLLTGATAELVPGAVLRCHVRPDSRNRGPAQPVKDAVHHAIVAANLG